MLNDKTNQPSLSSIVRKVMSTFQGQEVNPAVLYSEVCKLLGITDPKLAPNPGSVYRIGRRYRGYGR